MLKFIIFSIITFFVLFQLVGNKETLSEKEKIIYTITLNTIEKFEKKYGLKFNGISKSGEKKLLKNLELIFFMPRALNTDDGR